MRIVTTDPMSSSVKLFDADGHEVSLKTIRGITIDIPVMGLVTATIEVLAEIDIVGETEIKRKRITFDQVTGETTETVIEDAADE